MKKAYDRSISTNLEKIARVASMKIFTEGVVKAGNITQQDLDKIITAFQKASLNRFNKKINY